MNLEQLKYNRVIVPDGTRVRLNSKRMAFPSYAEWSAGVGQAVKEADADPMLSLSRYNASHGVVILDVGTEAVVVNSTRINARLRLNDGREYDVTQIIVGEQIT